MSFKVEALPGKAQKKLVQDPEGKLGSGNSSWRRSLDGSEMGKWSPIRKIRWGDGGAWGGNSTVCTEALKQEGLWPHRPAVILGREASEQGERKEKTGRYWEEKVEPSAWDQISEWYVKIHMGGKKSTFSFVENGVIKGVGTKEEGDKCCGLEIFIWQWYVGSIRKE